MITYTIRIPKLKLFGYHGCYENERKEGQEFEIDIEIFTKLTKKTTDSHKFLLENFDSLDNTIDYSAIVDVATEVFKAKKCNLLETLAYRISAVPFLLTRQFAHMEVPVIEIDSVKVKIRKRNPIGMPVPYVELEVINNSDKGTWEDLGVNPR